MINYKEKNFILTAAAAPVVLLFGLLTLFSERIGAMSLGYFVAFGLLSLAAQAVLSYLLGIKKTLHGFIGGCLFAALAIMSFIDIFAPPENFSMLTFFSYVIGVYALITAALSFFDYVKTRKKQGNGGKLLLVSGILNLIAGVFPLLTPIAPIKICDYVFALYFIVTAVLMITDCLVTAKGRMTVANDE